MRRRAAVCLVFLLLFGLVIGLVIGLAAAAPAGQGRLKAKLAGRQLSLMLAADRTARARGLGGLTSLAWDEGMLFVYPLPGPRGFWMKGMKMSIDIIWIYQGRVTGIAAQLPPPQPGQSPARAQSPGPVDLVLEVNAGWSKASGLKIGDEFTLVDPLPLAGE